MACVSEALLVIVLFLLGMCLNSVTSDNQEEPVKFSVASQTLRSFNQHKTSNHSSSNDSLDLRTAKHQRLNESFREPLVLSNHRKPSGRSSANLRDIKQLKTPKPPFRSLEFSNQHKQTASSSDNLVYANQRKHPRSPTNSLDFSNRHYGASTSSGDFSTSENSHVLPNFSKDLIRPHLSRSRKNFCPKHCRCTYCQDRTIYTVDCSNRGLRKIPDLPQTSRNVYLQNNDIEDVACRKMEHLKNLKELNLSQNGRIKLFNCSFATVNSLERLWLARCNLGSLPIGIFHSLRHLLELDLSENNITTLEAQLFSNMHELMSLNLGQNRLGRVRNNTFQGLGALVFLSLKENLLYYLAGTFETDAFQGLTSLKSLHLEGNQPNFREDLIYPDQALTRVPTLEYLWLDGFLRRLGPELLPQLVLICVNQVIFVSVLSVFSMMLGSLAVCSLYHYKRWQWKYLFYLSRNTLHIGSTHINFRPAAHAFVTYDQDNSRLRYLMRHLILPRLHQLGVTTVLGETDFGGGPLYNSIAGAVTSTNKTLVFFSEDIFQEFKRQTEVNLAIMHELHLRRPVLVPVILLKPEELSPRDVDAVPEDNQPSRRRTSRVRRRPRGVDHFARFKDLLTHFPPEIAVFLRGQVHRCLVYSEDTEHFWLALKKAIMDE
ncbi:hypothetical protein RRG08_020250 [Elysia crispata]|nr:hypothetical protein RRG08_020250 [Elysia crispata]